MKVKPVGKKQRTVRVHAQRWVEAADRVASDADSEYVGEFKLQGLRSQVTFADLTYDYCEISGLLCVYVDRFYLKDQRLFVAQQSFPAFLSTPSFVPMEAPQKKGKTWLRGWLPVWLGGKAKEAPSSETRAELYRRSLNANLPGRRLSKMTDKTKNKDKNKGSDTTAASYMFAEAR